MNEHQLAVDTWQHPQLTLEDLDIESNVLFRWLESDNPIIYLSMTQDARSGNLPIGLSRSEMLAMIKFMDENTDA